MDYNENEYQQAMEEYCSICKENPLITFATPDGIVTRCPDEDCEFNDTLGSEAI